MRSIASFDVFDTLLTRRVATPTSLFILLGERALHAGFIEVDASAFHKKRIIAEEEARRTIPGREVTLDEIYGKLISMEGISASAGIALSSLEMDVEAEFMTPVPGANEMVRAARERHAQIIFVSDMYLPSAFIRTQLETHGFWQKGDRLFVSGDWKASKADGSLFQAILKHEKIRPSALIHIGDRIDADFEVPSRLGIKARHAEPCRFTRYETMLEEFSAESSGFTSLVAGASRLARLRNRVKNANESTLSGLACSLISPIITFYVVWLLKEATQRKLQRLYFVARDGYLVKKIAEALVKALGIQLELRYLYGSRQAWHIPAITELSSDSLSWLFERTRTVTPRIILDRLQMSPSQIAVTLSSLGWPQACWNQCMDEESLRRFREDLLGSAVFRGEVERLVNAKQLLAVQYLEQEGLFDATPWAIVDLGWHGRLQLSLESLLGTKQPTSTVGLYFGLFSDSPALTQLNTASYLDWDLRAPPESKEIPSLVFLMESFCTAPHGSTIGYNRQVDGYITPKCRDQGFEALEKWGISSVHAAIDEFSRRLGELSFNDEILNWDSRPALLQILGTFSRTPLASEARAWGTFPYEDEQAGTVRERLTRGYELSWENLRAAWTFGDERLLPASWKVLWHGGQTHVLSAENVLLKIALKLGAMKCFLGQVIRRWAKIGYC